MNHFFEALNSDIEDWHGFKCYRFLLANVKCIVVTPKSPNPQRLWVWRARFFGHEPQFDVALLEQGFHLVYCDVSELFGSPIAVQRWNTFYDFATSELGLAKKMILEGMSRGGLAVFNWAVANPDQVSAIYADAPVCDIKSWPGGKGTGKGAPREWQSCLEAYDFSNEDDALNYRNNPLDMAEALGKTNIPIMIVYGKDDDVVPPSENCLPFSKKFLHAGGTLEMIGKENCNHHPHSLKDPQPIVDFILKHQLSSL